MEPPALLPTRPPTRLSCRPLAFTRSLLALTLAIFPLLRPTRPPTALLPVVDVAPLMVIEASLRLPMLPDELANSPPSVPLLLTVKPLRVLPRPSKTPLKVCCPPMEVRRALLSMELPST